MPMSHYKYTFLAILCCYFAFLQSEPASEITMEEYIEQERLVNIKNRKQQKIHNTIASLINENDLNVNWSTLQKVFPIVINDNSFDSPVASFFNTLNTITAETSDETVAAIKNSAQDCVTKIKAPNTKNQGITLERILKCMTLAIKKHNK